MEPDEDEQQQGEEHGDGPNPEDVEKILRERFNEKRVRSFTLDDKPLLDMPGKREEQP